jgi:hypothetical protein
MTSTDLFRRRANEFRRLAAAARNTNDRAFWLGLAERWRAARQRCLKQILAGNFEQKHSPGRGGRAAGAKSRHYET